MKKVLLALLIFVATTLMLSGCHTDHPEYCTVKGTVQGLSDGTKLVLQDEFQHYDIVGTGVVKQGAFEIHPDVTSPTHVYLYTKKGKQLKDFILEPGTILTEVDANDETDYATGATGTPSNDLDHRFVTLYRSENKEAAKALMDSILDAETTGALALDYANNWNPPTAQALGVLDRLSPDLAGLDFVADFRETLTRRLKTEPRTEGSDFIPLYIDMEYPDVDGNPVSLSSVVNNPDNLYVLVDFWATWCSGCVNKLPELVELYAKYHEKGLEIYGISVDRYRKEWKTYLETKQLGWVNVCDGTGGKNSQVLYDYALPHIPTTVLIDGQTSEIIARDEDDWDAKLATLLP